MKLVDGFDSNYRFVQVAAKRARQLQNGAKPALNSNTRKACRLAMDEVTAGKVEWIVPEKKKTAVETAEEFFAGTDLSE